MPFRRRSSLCVWSSVRETSELKKASKKRVSRKTLLKQVKFPDRTENTISGNGHCFNLFIVPLPYIPLAQIHIK